MRVTIDIPNQKLSDKILWLLGSFKDEGVEIISKNGYASDEVQVVEHHGVDFSSFNVESFKELDGLEYQKMVRDGW